MRACACSTALGQRVEQDLKGEQWHPFGRLRLYDAVLLRLRVEDVKTMARA
jgi:hypothetical protein